MLPALLHARIPIPFSPSSTCCRRVGALRHSSSLPQRVIRYNIHVPEPRASSARAPPARASVSFSAEAQAKEQLVRYLLATLPTLLLWHYEQTTSSSSTAFTCKRRAAVTRPVVPPTYPPSLRFSLALSPSRPLALSPSPVIPTRARCHCSRFCALSPQTCRGNSQESRGRGGQVDGRGRGRQSQRCA